MPPQLTYSHSDLETLWVLNGGSETMADTAAAIAEAESGGCLYAKAGPTDDRPIKTCTYRFTTTENSYGLWQINRDAHPRYSASTLYTAQGNAAAAVAIAVGGSSFQPWTTYKTGAYKQYLTGTVSITPQPGGTFTPAPADPIELSIAGFHQLGLTLARGLPRNLHSSLVLRRQALRNLSRLAKMR